MEIIISSFGDKGFLANERVGFSVKSRCNLKHFLIFRTTFTEGGFVNRSNNAYWFLPTDVEPGDKVVLYTKVGSDSIKTNSDGTKIYFRYWGLSEPIFTNEKNGIVLAALDNWSLSNKVK